MESMHPRLTVYPRFTTNRQEDTDPGTTRTVHPRACGEQNEERPPFDSFVGSSPRVRGTDLQLAFAVATYRFIPARAGNRAEFHSVRDERRVHPRACGEQTTFGIPSALRSGSSPRVRGTVRLSDGHQVVDRFIPARAGNSLFPCTIRWHWSVHPRACGEQSDEAFISRVKPGSSPRVRGTVPTPASPPGVRRFIPARAGNRSDIPHTHQPAAGSSPRVRGTVAP